MGRKQHVQPSVDCRFRLVGKSHFVVVMTKDTRRKKCKLKFFTFFLSAARNMKVEVGAISKPDCSTVQSVLLCTNVPIEGSCWVARYCSKCQADWLAQERG